MPIITVDVYRVVVAPSKINYSSSPARKNGNDERSPTDRKRTKIRRRATTIIKRPAIPTIKCLTQPTVSIRASRPRSTYVGCAPLSLQPTKSRIRPVTLTTTAVPVPVQVQAMEAVRAARQPIRNHRSMPRPISIPCLRINVDYVKRTRAYRYLRAQPIHR